MIDKQMNPKVNALVALIDNNNPDELLRLRMRYPAHANLFERGAQLGESESDLAVRVEIALRGLRIAGDRMDPNFLKLRRRLLWANRIRFGGSIVATLSSVGLVAAVCARYSGIATMVTVAVNLLASLSTLMSEYLEATIHGTKGGVRDLFETLVELGVDRDQVQRELELCQRIGSDQATAMELVSRANAIAARLLKIERLLSTGTQVSRYESVGDPSAVRKAGATERTGLVSRR